MAAASMDLGHTFGAMLIGSMISTGLYGITTLQTYFYFRNYELDDLETKSLVWIVWILDTIHVAFMGHAMYFYLITGYGKPTTLTTGLWSLWLSLLTNIIVAFISQTFFARRIHTLCPRPWKWILTAVTAIIVLAHFVFGIETVVQFFRVQKFDRLKEVDKIAVVPFGIFAVLSDILIAAALVLLLRQHRTEYEDTNNIITKLIVYAVNRCVLTSLVAIIEIILFLAIPHSLFAFAFDFVIGKLYANSLLAHLNSRKSLTKRALSTSGGTATGTGFEVNNPQAYTFNLGPIESGVRPTSSASVRDTGRASEDESRGYATSLPNTTDKRRPPALGYDDEGVV